MENFKLNYPSVAYTIKVQLLLPVSCHTRAVAPRQLDESVRYGMIQWVAFINSGHQVRFLVVERGFGTRKKIFYAG